MNVALDAERTALTQVRTYHITQNVGFFPEVNVLAVSLASITLAVQLHMFGRAKHSQGDYMVMEAMHLENEVRFPLFGPVAAVVANKLPDEIQIGVVDQNRRTPESELTGGTWGAKAFTEYVFQPFLVNYYERHVFEIRGTSGPANAWPIAWQMGRVVRNAISHNGNVHFKNLHHPPVSWRGLTISPANQGKRLLGPIMNGADLFVLAADMEEERSPGTLKTSKSGDH